ncbi:MAG: hypothetical protein ABSH20_13060 [Tepidisphaeraceae bacterium]
MKKGIVTAVCLVACMTLPALAKRPDLSNAAQPAALAAKPAPAGAAAKAPAAATSAQLRQEWKMGDLKLTHEAIDDATYPPDIRQSAIDAVDWFLGQQESLLADVDSKPENAAKARQARLNLDAQFQQKMAVIYKNPQFKAELDRRLAALDKEMDDMAAGAQKLFAKLDASGITARQKADLKPLIASAAKQLKTVKDSSDTGSTKDAKVREDAVQKFRQAKAAIKQKLTADQKEKLKKKEVEDN